MNHLFDASPSAGPANRPQPSPSAAPAVKGHWLLSVLKLAIAVAAIPVCIGMTRGFIEYAQVENWFVFRDQHSRFVLTWLGIGAASFAVLSLFVWRPVVVYVFAHELTHALAAWMCLARVSNLRASASGGQVTTSRSNTFIRLAPYALPLYAFLAVGAYAAVNTWVRPLESYFRIMLALLGFLYALHLAFTLWSLRRDQPDLKPDGWFFSFVTIYLANLVCAAVLLNFAFTGSVRGTWPVLKQTAQSGWQSSKQVYRYAAETARKTAHWLPLPRVASGANETSPKSE